jgi:hypothetical protein
LRCVALMCTEPVHISTNQLRYCSLSLSLSFCAQVSLLVYSPLSLRIGHQSQDGKVFRTVFIGVRDHDCRRGTLSLTVNAYRQNAANDVVIAYFERLCDQQVRTLATLPYLKLHEVDLRTYGSDWRMVSDGRSCAHCCCGCNCGRGRR